MSPKDIKSMYLCELKEDFNILNVQSYRADQVYNWLTKGARSFNDMTNISVGVKERLKQSYHILNVEIRKKLTSKVDGTVKYLFELYDESFVESVLMKYKHGYSLCISSQSGCKMRCAFCATGAGGFYRDLWASEMLSQIQAIQMDNNIRISNIVIMGMGEPLDNYDNTIRFLKLVSSKDSLNIGMRHISLSTCGLVDKIYKLSEEKLQITLSISLHAPNDYLRDKIMPVNLKWPITELIKACKHYIIQTGRRISFEYILIDGVNDSKENAEELSRLLRGMICHINLIPMNNVSETQLKRSSMKRVMIFYNILIKNGMNATIRRTLGSDINGSCGQLKQREMR